MEDRSEDVSERHDADEVLKRPDVNIDAMRAPIVIETASHRRLSLRSFKWLPNFGGLREALDAHPRDTKATAAAVLNLLRVDETEDTEGLALWCDEDLAEVVQAYMEAQRSGLRAPDPSTDRLDDFVQQCKQKLREHDRMMAEIANTRIMKFDAVKNALPDFPNRSTMLGFSAADALRVSSGFDMSRLTSGLLGLSGFDAASFAPRIDMSEFSAARLGIANLDATSSVLGHIGMSPLDKAMRGVTMQMPDMSRLTQAAAGLAFGGEPLQRFLDQSQSVWKSFERITDAIRERLRTDERLRAMGVDTDRVRIAGIYDWLSFVSEAIDEADTDEDAAAALTTCARSELVHESLFTLLRKLPADIRVLRNEAIRQALDAHMRGDYIASCSVLTAHLDGLIGDMLVEWQRHEGLPEDRLRGLRARVTNLERFVDPGGDYPSVISPDDGFAFPRNNIAHGDPAADYSEAHSAKLIFLVLSFLSLHLSGDDEDEEAG